MTEHFPTPWKIDPHSFSVYAADVPRGSPRVADMRGWGYLTGKGSGALGLSDDEGIAAQKANAELIVKAVNNHETLLDALRFALEVMESYAFSSGNDPRTATPESAIGRARAAIAAVVGGAAK